MSDFLTEINANGTTIIDTTHYLEEAEQMCRNIAIIDEGEIIENTSMKKLIAELDFGKSASIGRALYQVE
jgi:ABC-2 type transport system ATP-binding protein